MHHHYDDIRGLTDRKPIWFDEYAVPRYCEFNPDEVASIYASRVALVLIACQNCGHTFNVCCSEDNYSRLIGGSDLFGEIEKRTLHYGDPPNIRCCPAGPTMNCNDLRVLEAWHSPDCGEWTRKPELEIDLTSKSD